MAAPAATLELLLEEVRSLRREVADLRREKARPRLLSRRAAAKALGVGRGATLDTLIRDGRLRLVLDKIPADDLDRLVQEGVPAPHGKAQRQPRAPENEAQAIRALRV